MEYKPEIFQDELRKFRENKRYSYDKLAERSGIPMKTLKRWMLTTAPKSPPKRGRLLRLVAGLNLTEGEVKHFFNLVDGPLPTSAEVIEESRTETNEVVKAVLVSWANQLEGADSPLEVSLRTVAKKVLQIPPIPPHFVGRKLELKKLLAQLHITDQNKTIGLTGMGGVGKTSLAIRVAHLVKDRFADGVLWGQLGEGGSSPAAIAQSFATAFGEGHAVITALDDVAKGTELRRILANKHVLVIFDNVENSAQLQHLLPGGERNLTLVTSRNRKLLNNVGAEILQVQPFAEKDSLNLLKQWIDPHRVQTELDQAKQVASLVDGLPLALDVVGGYLKESPDLTFTEYITLLADESNRLAEISDWEDTTKNIEASFSLSIRRLKPTMQKLFAALSIFPGPHFSSEAVAAAVDKNLVKVKRDLGQLHSMSLIQSWEDTSVSTRDTLRYRLHALLKLYARTLLPEENSITHHHHAVTHFVEIAVNKAAKRETYNQLDLDWENINGMLRWAADNQPPAELITGVTSLTQTDLGVVGFLDVRGYWAEARELLTLATEAAQRQGEKSHLLAALFARLGLLAGRQGDKDNAEAYFSQSARYLADPPQSPEEALVKAELLAFKAIAEPDNESKYATLEDALNVLQEHLEDVVNGQFKAHVGYLKIMQGGVVGETGNLEDAIKLTEDGLSNLPDEPSPARFDGYINLSNFNYWLGNIEQCDLHTDDAIAMAEKWDDRPLLANLYALKGSNLLQQGRYQIALKAFKEGLIYCQNIGHVSEQATTHSNMGLCYHRLGKSEKALIEFQLGFKLAQEHQLPMAESALRLNLARYYLDHFNAVQAQSHAEQAHAICLAHELVYEVPEALSLQAEVALQQNQLEDALGLAEKSLSAATATKFQQAQGVSLRVMGQALLNLSRLDEALGCCQQSLETLTGQDPYEEGQTQLVLVNCHLARQEPQLALQRAYAARGIFEKLKATRDQKAAQKVIDTLQDHYKLG